MRIITGALKGRSIHDSHGHRTHPMSEKVRGALFNALGDIEGLTFLDAYGGSGALALEAVSHGAKSAVAVEIDKNENLKRYPHLAEKVTALRAITNLN